MDPLSITTAIMAFLASTYTICLRVEQFIEIPASVRKLKRGIQQFECELESLSRQSANPKIANHIRNDYVQDLIANARKDLETLQSTVSEVTRLQEQQIKIRRFKWIRNNKKCEKLRSNLEEAIRNLERLTILAFRELLQELSISENLQISQLCVEQLEELEILETAAHDDITVASGTTIIGPPGFPNPCTCQDRDTETTEHDTHTQSNVVTFSSNQTKDCTSSSCSAQRASRDGKNSTLSRMLHKSKILYTLRRKTLRYSLPARGTLGEGSDANRYAKTGNVAGLQRLIGLGVVQISATTPDGWTLLHAAAYYGQFDVVQFLLGRDANPDFTEHGGRKPSHLANMRALNVGATQVQKDVAALIPGGECFKDDHEMTPIHVAVLDLYDSGHKAHPDLSSLLKFADDVENVLKREDLNSFEAERRKESPMFEEVFQFYVQQVRVSRIEKRRVRIVDAADAIHGWTPYLWATVTGRREAMKTLIDNDANPFTLSEKRRNAIHLAAESRYAEIMASVLSIPRDPNGDWFDINLGDFWKETPLHVAASGSPTCVRMLLENGANRTAQQEDGKVPLHYAALIGDNECAKVDIVDQLSADLGPHINCKDDDGLTPIFDLLASPVCVDMLIRRGADLSVRDKKGRSLLHYAATDDNPDSLRILLKYCPVELTTAHDKDGNTPIACAFASKSAACAMILLEIDAVGDFHGKEGWSLVHHAAHWGDADVLETVLNHRTFRRGAKTRKGESAADIAKSAGSGTSDGNWKGRVKELLLEYDSRGRIARSVEEQMLIQAEALALR